MDSITQAVLGAGITGAVLGRSLGRKALLYGAILGTLPDLDVLASYPDPVSTMTFHRGYSHSVLVLTALAGALTAVIRRCFPNADYSAARLFMAIWLALVTHPLLDAFTSYGTQLLWPFKPVPQSWSSIFIIDPIYTLPMLCAVVVAAVGGIGRRTLSALRWTVGFGCLYLAFSLGGKVLSEQRVEKALTAQGIAIDAVFSSPMPLNTLLWRVVVKSDDNTYYEAITSLFDRKPPELLRQSLNTALASHLKDDPLYQRLNWFTGGWLRFDAIADALVVTDLRMGMPGHYTFRFKMGERTANGKWCVVQPQSWRGDRGGRAELTAIIERIFDQDQSLPLAQWAQRNDDVRTLPAATFTPASCNLGH